MTDFGVPERPPSGTRAVCAAWLALRAEVMPSIRFDILCCPRTASDALCAGRLTAEASIWLEAC